jgi:hypothetical protein
MKTCPCCKKENEEMIINCGFCRYPFEGSEREKAIHIGQFISTQKGVKFDSEAALKRSQKILAFLGIINLVYVIIVYKYMIPFDFILNVVIIGMFAWCAVTIYQSPLVKLMIPLVILFVFGVINIIILPQAFLDIILLRGSCAAVLIYSIILVRSHQKYVRKFEG